MASDKVNYPEASAIAQAIKYQLRTGKFWDELTPAAKETFDQIATACARTVSGDGAHWDGIIGFAHAAKSPNEPVRAEQKPDELADSVRRLAAERLARNLGESRG